MESVIEREPPSGRYNQCNVQLNFAPLAHAAVPIMKAVDALTPAGKTPLTTAVQQAAEVLDYRNKPGVVVVVTDGEETWRKIALRARRTASCSRAPACCACHRLSVGELLLDRRAEHRRGQVPR
jgi:hypothetical protein